jgi:SAM-dependent methyltransferase
MPSAQELRRRTFTGSVIRRLLRLLPEPLDSRLRQLRASFPPRGFTRLDRRTKPVQRNPFARGLPIDRYYIESFLRRWTASESMIGDIRGEVLEFHDGRYATSIGGAGLESSSVLAVHVIDVADNPIATVRADIADAAHLASGAYDTIICTQVLQYVFDARAAVATLARLLKPGGTLYLTVPGIAPDFGRGDGGGIEYWRFTAASARALLLEHFRAEDLVIETFGNVLVAVGFLHGLAAEEFSAAELNLKDPAYEMLVAVRAHKRLGLD